MMLNAHIAAQTLKLTTMTAPGTQKIAWHHQDCPECDKTFVFQTTIVLYYDAKTADCLNGGEHDYKKTDTIPERFARLRCETCGDEKPLPANAGVTGAEPKAERPC